MNGVGCSGKSTQAELLEKSDVGVFIHSYRYIRDYFMHDVIGYEKAKNMHLEKFLGLAALPWMLLNFEKNVRWRLKKGNNIVIDHWLGDIWADCPLDLDLFEDFLKNLEYPLFSEGYHIYLDIGSETLFKRAKQRDNMDKDDINIDEFYLKRNIYREMARNGYLIQVDGNRSPEQVHQHIKEIICEP